METIAPIGRTRAQSSKAATCCVPLVQLASAGLRRLLQSPQNRLMLTPIDRSSLCLFSCRRQIKASGRVASLHHCAQLIDRSVRSLASVWKAKTVALFSPHLYLVYQQQTSYSDGEKEQQVATVSPLGRTTRLPCAASWLAARANLLPKFTWSFLAELS